LNPTTELSNALEILIRMQDLASLLLREETLAAADVVIRPPVGHVEWLDFSDPKACIEAGRQATREALPRIEALLNSGEVGQPSSPASA